MIGLYVHHHGRGHVARAEAILRHLRSPATVLSSADLTGADLGGATVVELPLDVPAAGEPPPPDPPPHLHHAPLDCAGQRERTARIATWIARVRPSVLVVDVSVEVALLARLCGVPYVYVRQHGERTDLPHRLAYAGASALLAPYPAWLEEGDTGVRTVYTGGFSRLDGRPGRDAPGRRRALVLQGGGGGEVPAEALARAAPEWTVLVAGGVPAAAGARAVHLGRLDDPWEALLDADVVVGHAGHNVVMEAAAARRPLVCVAEDRPFGEQHAKAAALRRTGTAVVRETWPRAEQWQAALDEALAMGDAGARRLCDGRGAGRAAAFLDAQDAGSAPVRRASASSRSSGSRISSRRSPSQAITPR